MRRGQDRKKFLFVASLCITLSLAGLVMLLGAPAAGGPFESKALGALIAAALVVPLLFSQPTLFTVGILAFLLPDTRVPLKYIWFSARWVLLGLMALAFIVPAMIGRRRHLGISLPTAGLAWTAWLFITAVYSIDRSLTLIKAGIWTVIFLISFVGGPHLVKTAGLRAIMKGLLQVNLFIVGGSLLYLLTSPGSTMRASGLRGILANSNGLGLGLLMTVPAVFYFLASSGRGSRRWLQGLFVVNLAMIVASIARGAIVGALLSWIVLAIVASPRKIRVPKKLITSAALALIMYTVVLFFASRAGQTPLAWLKLEDAGNPILSARQDWWREDLKYIQRRLLLGYGFGTVAGSGRRWELSTWMGNVRERGSSPLAIWEETGIVGLGLFILFMAGIFRRLKRLLAWSRANYPHPRAAAAYALAFILIAALVESAVSGWMIAIGSFPALLFYILTGVVWYLGRTTPGAGMEAAQDPGEEES